MTLIKADGGVYFSKSEVGTAEAGLMIEGAGGRVAVPLETMEGIKGVFDEEAAKGEQDLVVLVTLSSGRKATISGFKSAEDVDKWISENLA